MLKLRAITSVSIAALILITLFGCKDFRERQGRSDSNRLSISEISFRDVPGITEDEITAIEELQRQTGAFTFASTPGNEAFINEDGKPSGYIALLCDWLTGLFGVRFQPEILEWNDLLDKMHSKEIDFASLTAAGDKFSDFFFTDVIAQRSVKIIRLEEGEALEIIALSRPLNYVFLEGSVVYETVSALVPDTYQAVFAKDYEAVYHMLKEGDADAFIDLNTAEGAFVDYNGVVAEDFFPLVFIPVSIASANPALEPLISVVTKVLRNGGIIYLTRQLYSQGYEEYLAHKLWMQLDDEEREYIKNNPVIKMGSMYYNYPIDFYNEHEGKWQGVMFDILKEASIITGLTFEVVHGPHTEWSELIQMLESGEVALLPQVGRVPAREGRFLWPDSIMSEDRYLLISRIGFPNLRLNDIMGVTVGLVKDYSSTTMFHLWFPDHSYTREYDSFESTFAALERGEVDVMLGSMINHNALTNYQERTGYKINFTFNHAYLIMPGFNKEETVLLSIMNKTFDLIDVSGITEQWMRKAFDYQARLLQSQRPWLIGAIILSLMVISLMLALFLRSRNVRKQLDILVRERTAELEIATEAAKAASKSKSSFLANMSHEIRTPMNTILGVTEIMMQSGDLTEDLEEKLDKIYNSSDMLMGIINDILDFSKIEAGKLDIIPAKYYIASLINDSVHLNMMRIGDKSIDFIVKIDENIPAKLNGDELRIKQILNNLLSNAFKYTDAGTVTLSVSSELCKAKSGQEVMLSISVQDTGQGMTPEQVGKLFDEYSRFNEEAGRAIEGTGLGLSITRQLLSLMNGKINVESEAGKGTVFTVNLPQGIIDSDVLGRELVESLQEFRMQDMLSKKRGQIARDPMPYGKVLVVDDVETNLYVAEGLMKPYSLNIDTVMSGYEAIDKLKTGVKYDIVFMDHMMPGMDGIEAVKHLRDMGYTEPIVALTANAVAGQADIFLQNGFDDFLSKPIDMRRLNTILNKLIRDKQPPEVIEEARKQIGKQEAVPEDGKQKIDTLLLESFNRDAQKVVKVLEELCGSSDLGTEENLKKFTTAAHGIKAPLNSIGEKKLSEAARKLETAGREGDSQYIKENTQQFLEGLQALLEKIIPARKEDGTDDNIELLREQLTSVQKACEDYNRKDALELLDKLKQQSCSKETREVLDRVTENVLHSKFEEAEEIILMYAENLLSGSTQDSGEKSILNKKIDGMDIAKGLDKFNNDAGTYIKVLRSYTTSIKPLINLIKNISEETLIEYQRAVHSVKGTSLDIFAKPVGRKAEELENAAKANNLSFIEKENPLFLENVEKLIYNIEEMLNTADVNNDKPKKDKIDSELLSKLRTCSENYDMDGVDETMEEIETYQYETDAGLCAWLRENVDVVDFEGIAEKLSGYKK